MLVRQSIRLIPRFLTQVNLSILGLCLAFFMALSPATSFAAKPEKSIVVTDVVNINRATPEQIAQALTGVGIKKAEAIVAYRTAQGKFTSIDQLVDVKGIGQSTLEKNRKRIEI